MHPMVITNKHLLSLSNSGTTVTSRPYVLRTRYWFFRKLRPSYVLLTRSSLHFFHYPTCWTDSLNIHMNYDLFDSPFLFYMPSKDFCKLPALWQLLTPWPERVLLFSSGQDVVKSRQRACHNGGRPLPPVLGKRWRRCWVHACFTKTLLKTIQCEESPTTCMFIKK